MFIYTHGPLAEDHWSLCGLRDPIYHYHSTVRTAAILKIRKHAYLGHFWTDLQQIWIPGRYSPCGVITPQNCTSFKIQDGGQPPYRKYVNTRISVIFGPICSKLRLPVHIRVAGFTAALNYTFT